MTEELKKRKSEICRAFGMFLAEIFPDENVVGIEYRYDEKTGDEYAEVIFASGYMRPVNVNCDSGMAIMSDIIQSMY